VPAGLGRVNCTALKFFPRLDSMTLGRHAVCLITVVQTSAADSIRHDITTVFSVHIGNLVRLRSALLGALSVGAVV